MPRSRLQVLVGVALFGTLALAGCGGSSHQSSNGGTTTATGTTTPTSTTVATVKPNKHALSVGVRASGSNAFVPAMTARPGDKVAFRVVLPEKRAGALIISAAVGPASTLTITGSAGGQTASAKITSAAGSPITLVRLSYTCDLPPHPTFCPAKSDTASAGRARLEFIASHRTAVEISAVVGPVSLEASKTLPPGNSSAPPYTVAELLRVRSPGTPAPAVAAKPQATVSASPGQVVTMYSHLKSHTRGRRQPVTVTFSPGPGSSLTVTASVPGGIPSTATIRSATGSPIMLVKPRFECYVAPLPSFCPATHVGRSARGYTLTFPAAPGTPEVEVSATVQAG